MNGTNQNSTAKTFDVVVVGAGIVGLSCAYHILSQDPTRQLVIVDKAPAAGQGDTARTVAGVRNTFTSKVNRLLAESSINFYRHIQEDLGVDLHLEFTGYLWLLTDHMLKQIEPQIKDMKDSGVELRLWEQDQLSEMLTNSHLSVDPTEETKMLGLVSIVKGLQGVKCGTLAAEKLVEFYEKEIHRMGGMIHYGERVISLALEPTKKLEFPREPLVWQQMRIGGVITNRGRIDAGNTVLAAGNWSTELLNAIGVDSHIRSKKRQVFALRGTGVTSLLHSKGFNEQGVLPLTLVPPCSIYLKSNRREQTLWTGVSDDLGRTFTFEEEPMAEEDFYTYNIYPILSHYFPQLKNVRPYNMWAGHYDINTIDANPYVFEKPGIIVTAGMSGSGMMKADAIGRIVAAINAQKDIATLYGGSHFRASTLGIEERQVDRESFVI